MTKSTSQNQIFDIAIVGAGPGGLCAAHALAKLGFSIGIFERAQALRPIGASIGMGDMGFAPLAEISQELAEQVRALGANPKRQILMRPSGEILFADESPLAETGFTFLSWYNLQSCLRETLPNTVSLHFNHGLTNFTRTSNSSDAPLCLKFDQKPEIFARLMIGADGYRSVVRSITVADGAPIYSISAGETALQMFDKWPTFIERVIRATDPDTIVETGVFDREPVPQWGDGWRVTLLGDAAHAMRPSLGLGTTMAIQDAVALAKVLKGINLDNEQQVAAALNTYEQERIGVTAPLQRQARENGTASHADDIADKLKVGFEAALAARRQVPPQDN